MKLPENIRKAFGAVGAVGGRSKSESKTAASRKNGKRGGRPESTGADEALRLQVLVLFEQGVSKVRIAKQFKIAPATVRKLIADPED
jgi:DNA invertase Pin-like site-specific DNA recombinase